MSLKKIEIAGLFLLILLFFSCSGNTPELNEVWWQLNLEKNPTNGIESQSLSLFVHGDDEDGDDDLDKLYLINDDYQLFWEISSDEWSEYTEQGVIWIGSNGLKAPGNGTFPKGNYRVLLIDLAGERDEKTFYLRNSIPSEEERLSPDITFNMTTLTVLMENPLFQIWFYNEEGELVEKSRSFGPGTHQWNQIARNITRRAKSFSLYTEPESGAWGYISGPYFFSE